VLGKNEALGKSHPSGLLFASFALKSSCQLFIVHKSFKYYKPFFQYLIC